MQNYINNYKQNLSLDQALYYHVTFSGFNCAFMLINRTTTPTGAVESFKLNLHSYNITFNYRIFICLAMHVLNVKSKEENNPL